MTTSKPESLSYESAATKANSKKQNATSSPRKYKSLEGKEYSVEEMRMLNWEKRIEILLFSLLQQGDELEKIGKKILDT